MHQWLRTTYKTPFKPIWLESTLIFYVSQADFSYSFTTDYDFNLRNILIKATEINILKEPKWLFSIFTKYLSLGFITQRLYEI